MENVTENECPHLADTDSKSLEVTSTSCLECGVSAPTRVCMTCGTLGAARPPAVTRSRFEVERPSAHTRASSLRAAVHMVLRVQRLFEELSTVWPPVRRRPRHRKLARASVVLSVRVVL